jgi:hypothetical protein
MVTSQDASSPVLFGGTRLRPVERLGRLVSVAKRQGVATTGAIDQFTRDFPLVPKVEPVVVPSHLVLDEGNVHFWRLFGPQDGVSVVLG